MGRWAFACGRHVQLDGSMGGGWLQPTSCLQQGAVPMAGRSLTPPELPLPLPRTPCLPPSPRSRLQVGLRLSPFGGFLDASDSHPYALTTYLLEELNK